MSRPTRPLRGFTLVEIMIVVGIVGILSLIAVPALLHVKQRSEDTLVLNTIRNLYDAKERYFLEDGAGKTSTNLSTLLKTGFASHSLEAATLHNIGNWPTTALHRGFLFPGNPVTITEEIVSGRRIAAGRHMEYPAPQK